MFGKVRPGGYSSTADFPHSSTARCVVVILAVLAWVVIAAFALILGASGSPGVRSQSAFGRGCYLLLDQRMCGAVFATAIMIAAAGQALGHSNRTALAAGGITIQHLLGARTPS